MPRDRYDDEDDDRPRRSRRRDDDDDDRPRRRSRDEDDDRSGRRSRDEDEYEDRPRRSRRRRDDDFDRPPVRSGNGMAVASLVLGLISICLGPITGLIGGILGLVALRKPSGKGLAITGILLSGLFSVVWIGFVVWSYLEYQNRKKETLSYKMVGLGAHSYHDANSALPKPYYDTRAQWDARPNEDLSSKLSWRVGLLPYLEQDSLFRQFKTDESWDSSTNRPLADRPLSIYSDIETPNDPTTRLRVFYDNGAMFDTQKRRSLVLITDGTSNTIMYVEGGDKVTWSRFQEYKYDPRGSLPPLGKPNKPTFLVTMADGSVRSLRKSTSETTLRAMITADGGEFVDIDR